MNLSSLQVESYSEFALIMLIAKTTSRYSYMNMCPLANLFDVGPTPSQQYCVRAVL